MSVIARDADLLREKRLKQKAGHAKQVRSRLRHWSGERRAARGGLKNGLPWDVYHLSEQLLKAREPGWVVLERVESPAAAGETCERLADDLTKIAGLLDESVFSNDGEGAGGRAALPHRGVRRYVQWQTFPFKLYLALVQESTSSPMELILGTTDRKASRPVPALARLEVPLKASGELPESPQGKKVPRQAAKNTVARAKKLLAGKEPALVELQAREFEDEADAHDEGLIETYYEELAQSFATAVAQLTEEFGPPSSRSRDQHPDIPHGVMEYAMWEMGGQRLYVTWDHEDRELPIELILGTLAGSRPAKPAAKRVPPREGGSVDKPGERGSGRSKRGTER